MKPRLRKSLTNCSIANQISKMPKKGKKLKLPSKLHQCDHPEDRRQKTPIMNV